MKTIEPTIPQLRLTDPAPTSSVRERVTASSSRRTIIRRAYNSLHAECLLDSSVMFLVILDGCVVVEEAGLVHSVVQLSVGAG